ncbi:UDP-3-O-(3-hydroxymyristoyl)glucosamine N-acyltransferase [Prolixibacter denitrificans]|uniref:UDP-3-O-acylglucosamine N-acyltransferase n=1 Tax=Prolixibacter denitrificans TaxID=1541063 RepID=A0A2P8CI90_9BACT|nr:UDP-3-O-(3-hydroxymyristoyl)glucosamine N-acyltransferase [Prolixibacter denitrificans]PSK84681.1 UDP-3-O-[3-hydroxymyristoyl] glucosamine N-acyltransferase [Prolixibacter denitrificans]GET20847.1 UDP-3-O-acylglucosamine N-acyltransferase [Prolixibacter denitrificans]
MEFSANDIAGLLGGEVEGDGSVKVNNVSKIDQGIPGTLAFLANPAYAKYIYTTKASVVLVNRDFQPEDELSCTLIRVDDAYASIAKLLNYYEQSKPKKVGVEQPSFISESASVGEQAYVGAFAYVGEKATIGKNVKIYPNVYIGDGAAIGDDTILYAGVKIYAGCKVGKNCILHAGVVVGSDGFGFAPTSDGSYDKIAQVGNVEIYDNVEIGSNTTIDCATMGSTVINEGVKIDNLVQIAHNVEVGKNTVIVAQVGVAGSAKIGENCMIGGQVGIAGHIRIGNNVKIGAQSGISNNVKDNSTIFGTPAFGHRDFMKSYAVFKNLPQLRSDVIELGRKIKDLDESNS